MTELSLHLLAARRAEYERGLLALVAAGRALAECKCWHHDADRIAGISDLADCIRTKAHETSESLRRLQELEAQILGE